MPSRGEPQPGRTGEQGEGGGGDRDGPEQAPEQPLVTCLQQVGAKLAAQRTAEQPELELPTSGTPPADRQKHQQQPEWERCKGQWQQPNQVGGDKAKQAQKRHKQAELANRDPARRHPRARAIGLCSLRSRASRNRLRNSSRREGRRVVGGWCGHGDLLGETSGRRPACARRHPAGVRPWMDLPYIARMLPCRPRVTVRCDELPAAGCRHATSRLTSVVSVAVGRLCPRGSTIDHHRHR